jgi:hypothetical protein
VLRAAEGATNTQIATEAWVSLPMVGLWRRSFCERRLEGLSDAPRSGRLRRGVHGSVPELNADIQDWVKHWNENPNPYVWTKTADEILDNLAGYCNTINASGR